MNSSSIFALFLVIILTLSSSVRSRVYSTDGDIDNHIRISARHQSSYKIREKRNILPESHKTHPLDEKIKSSFNKFSQDSNKFASVTELNYTHSKTVFLLTCQGTNGHTYNKRQRNGCTGKSNLYRSNDYGDHFELLDKTFKDAHLHCIYIFPNHISYVILTDYTNKTMYISTDYGLTFKKHQLTFSLTFLYFHPTLSNYLLAFDKSPKGDNSLYVSEDSGQTWQLISKRVRNYFWAQNSQNQNSTKIYFEVATGKRRNHLIASLVFTANSPYKTVEKAYDEDIMPFTLYVGKQFLIIQSWKRYKLYLSYGSRVNFKKVIYDVYSRFHYDYKVLDNHDDELLLALFHGSFKASLYLSGRGHSSNLLTLVHDNVIVEKMTNFTIGAAPQLHFYKVNGLFSTYIINSVKKGTAISFNKGLTWSPLKYKPSPREKCPGIRCQIFLNMNENSSKNPILSKSSVPGVILAQGYVADYDNKTAPGFKHHVYASTDGGYSWSRTLDGSFQFLFLNNGGLIVAMRLNQRGPIMKHLLYFSTDFGQDWHATNLTLSNRHIISTFEESTKNSLTVNILGLSENGTRSMWRIDFSGLFSRKCDHGSDFVDWHHNQNKCVLGERDFNKRRSPKKLCIVDPNHDNNITRVPCPCIKEDFTCDYLFDKVTKPDLDYYECKAVNKHHINIDNCQASDVFYESRGFRRIHGDRCVGGVADQLEPIKKLCPVIKPDHIRFKVFPSRQEVGATVTIELLNYEQSTYNTTLTWDFGDNLAPIHGPFEEMRKMRRKYYDHGTYNITVIATNSKGQSASSHSVIIYDNDIFSKVLLARRMVIVVNVTYPYEVISGGKCLPSVVFNWVFDNVALAGKNGNSVNYTFTKTGWFSVKVSLHSTYGPERLLKGMLRVYNDAVWFLVSFSRALDDYNTKTKEWREQFNEKFKFFLAIKYDIHDFDRIIVDTNHELPTQVTVTFVDTEDTINSSTNNANALAIKVINGINEERPLLHGYAAKDIHLLNATGPFYIKPQLTNSSFHTRHSKKQWIYAAVFCTVFFALCLLFVFVFVYRRRKGTLQFWKKDDGMESTLFTDNDENFG